MMTFPQEPKTRYRMAKRFLLVFACTFPGALAGQTVLDLGSFAPCEQCELHARSVASVGASSGEGTIDNELPWVVSRPGGGYLVIDGYTRFKLFDAQGNFVRSVGREGDGPGELRNIATGAAFVGNGGIVLLDGIKRAWIQFDEDGTFVSQKAQDLTPGRFLLLEGDTLAVIASIDQRPNSVGYPLHLVDIRNGSVLRHFGSADGAWNMAEPAAGRIVLGLDDATRTRVWWGKMGRMHLEEWSVNGVHIRTVTGNLPWFPPIPPPGVRIPGKPDSFMPTFAVDDADRLWMVTVVPDDRWREVERRGPEGAISAASREMMFDSRIDVFDLRSQTHVGFKVWDHAEIRLVRQGGQVLVSTLEYGSSLEPRVILHEVILSPSKGRHYQ